MNSLLVFALVLPLLALLAVPFERSRRIVLVAAPLPLILSAVAGPVAVALPSMLLGSSFAVDDVNRPLLLLAGVGWTLAGWFGGATVTERPREFAVCWLLTLLGQAVGFLGADLLTYYLGYVVMTLAPYGLVVHARTAEALRAGRVYLVLALLGEVLVLVGLLSLGTDLGNVSMAELALLPRPGAGSVLLVAGFAVKLGVVPLHVWLPLAHPAAPAAASAVLSGLLVKAGLLGMLRLVPSQSLDASELLMSLGLFSAAYGVVVGLFQTRIKTALAYSTISQMGLALVGFATVQAGVTAPAALGLFVLHHGLNKIALFIAAGHRISTRASQLLFLLPAMGLVGFPLSSGMLAKSALKHSLSEAGASSWILGLAVSSALTTTLMLHAYSLARAHAAGREEVHPAWVVSSLSGLVLPWAWVLWQGLPATIHSASLLDALWPVLAGAAAWLASRRFVAKRGLRLPEGDMVVVFEKAATRTLRMLDRSTAWRTTWRPPSVERVLARSGLDVAEAALGRIDVAGALLLGALLALWLTMS